MRSGIVAEPRCKLRSHLEKTAGAAEWSSVGAANEQCKRARRSTNDCTNDCKDAPTRVSMRKAGNKQVFTQSAAVALACRIKSDSGPASPLTKVLCEKSMRQGFCRAVIVASVPL